MGKTKKLKYKREKTKNKIRKKKKIKGEKQKARKKRKNNRNKERHGPAYYFVCFDSMKMFVSRMKKASNLIRQAKRIETFEQITNNKFAKV